MGIYINLDIKMNKVSSELWTNTFNEVLSFIDNTPLGYRKNIKHNDTNYIIYSKPELLVDNEGFEYISLSADLNRLTHCESFELYNNKDAYNTNDSDVDTETNIWRAKTQGFSYHKYILAVGMLIEHKLSGLAYVSGDITKEDISEAKLIIKDILNIEVDAPKRFEGDESLTQMIALMSLFGASIGDYIAETSDCLDFGRHLINTLIDGARVYLHKFSTDELKSIIIRANNKHHFTWSKDILDEFINTSNRDLLLGYTALLTVDLNNRDAFEYVCRFFKDKDVFNEYISLLNTSKPSINFTKP